MVIVIYAGYQASPLDPKLLSTTGLGGTEQCIIYLAEQLANLGYEVIVTGEVVSKNYSGVKYRCLQELQKSHSNAKVDWVIGVGYINYLLELSFINFDKSFFWIHNTEFYPWHRGEELPNAGVDLLLDERLTFVVCLTEWHKQLLQKTYPSIRNKTIVIGNGVPTNKFLDFKQKLPNSFVYTSHSERGLLKVIKDWKTIKTKLPNATLHISTPNYGLDYFNEYFLHLIENDKTIKFYGSLPQKNLYKLLSRCEYWYYPTDYEETFCITALEMLGHGVKPIANELAGLKETLNKFNLGSLWNLNKDYNIQDACKYAKSCDWNRIKNQWNKYILNMDVNNSSNVQKQTPFGLECVYIISLTIDQNSVDRWTSDIRNKLIPWYDGPIICKKATNGATLNSEWYEKNGYAVYENWELPDIENEFWNRGVTSGEVGCAISHHRIWTHAHQNKFKRILVLEEDFEIVSEVSLNLLRKVPPHFDLFYLGRNLLENWGHETFSDVPLGDTGIVKTGPSFNTHAYILSLTGVQKLLSKNFNKNIFPVDDFFIATTTGHIRTDLDFIKNDVISFGVVDDLVTQNRISTDEGPRTMNEPEYNEDEIFYEEDVESSLNHDRQVLHQDLYSYWENPDDWKEKFLTYSARTQEWDLIIDEPFDNCFSMPLFSQEFCEKIREEAEHSNAWTTDRHEFYPTTDMLLEAIDFTSIYYEVLKEYVMPASIHAFGLDGKGWDEMESEDFLAKYVPNAQGHLSLHHDASQITALVTLSNFDEYEGGGTYFSHQKKLVKEKQGYVSIHPGNITHKHGARATTKGTRYIIVSFMKNVDIMK